MILIGINMMNLFKLIKIMNNNETLSLFVEKADKNRLGIKINNNEPLSIRDTYLSPCAKLSTLEPTGIIDAQKSK